MLTSIYGFANKNIITHYTQQKIDKNGAVLSHASTSMLTPSKRMHHFYPPTHPELVPGGMRGCIPHRLISHTKSRLWCGSYAVSANSGNSALQLALLAAGVTPGDEVIVPALTHISTAYAVSAVGVIPSFVDIDPHTLTIDLQAVKNAIREETVAVIAAMHQAYKKVLVVD